MVKKSIMFDTCINMASRCTTDRLQVSLRTVTCTFCHGVLRSVRFIITITFLVSAVTAVADF